MACKGCKKLNLGAGLSPQGGGFINHDIVVLPNIDVVWDLNEIPWPWGDNEFDLVRAFSVFEHLKNDLITTLNECWRIIKPEGILNVKYPTVSNLHLNDDPTHRWIWTMKTIDFVDPSTKYGKECGYYTNYHWSIKTKEERKGNCFAILSPIK